MVYVREAHAIDGRSPKFSVLMEEPVTDSDRLANAKVCMAKLDLEPIPAVIDRVDNKIGAAYSAWPDRLYLVGKDGKIAYAGGRGPFGFKPDELEASIKTELGKSKDAGAKNSDK